MNFCPFCAKDNRQRCECDLPRMRCELATAHRVDIPFVWKSNTKYCDDDVAEIVHKNTAPDQHSGEVDGLVVSIWCPGIEPRPFESSDIIDVHRALESLGAIPCAAVLFQDLGA